MFFSLPNAISLDWIAPWPQAHVATWPCGVVSSLHPPFPLPLDWFLWSGSGLIDLQQPYISAAVPLQLVAPVMPYSQINQSDPRCAYWSLSPKLETQLQIKVQPRLKHGQDNAGDYLQ